LSSGCSLSVEGDISLKSEEDVFVFEGNIVMIYIVKVIILVTME